MLKLLPCQTVRRLCTLRHIWCTLNKYWPEAKTAEVHPGIVVRGELRWWALEQESVGTGLLIAGCRALS